MSWREVKTVDWVGDHEFVSEQEGGLIALEPLERGVSSHRYLEDMFRPSSLLHTTDSGRTWEEIQPAISS